MAGGNRDRLTLALAVIAAVSVLCFIVLAARLTWLKAHRQSAVDARSLAAQEPPFEVQLAIAQQTVAALNLRDSGQLDQAIAALQTTVANYPQAGRYLAEPYLALGWCYRKKQALDEHARKTADAETDKQNALTYFDLTTQVAPPSLQEYTEAEAAASRIRGEAGMPEEGRPTSPPGR
jgi:tetratricopeptide (TPR) repeat protein